MSRHYLAYLLYIHVCLWICDFVRIYHHIFAFVSRPVCYVCIVLMY